MNTITAKLIGWHELAPEVRHFDFEIPGTDEFAFTPGQFVSVVEREDGKEVTRAYSIASPRGGNRFGLCLNRVQDGVVSSFLFGLRPGDEIQIGEPLGYFTVRHPGHRLVFVATGTGVAPFRSILLDHLPKTHPHVTLLFGVRHENALLYREDLEQLAQQYPTFRFLPTVTRPSENWQGRTGRVQTHLPEALALHEFQDPSTVDIYICGMPDMVDEVRKLLKSHGFDRKQIVYEKYE